MTRDFRSRKRHLTKGFWNYHSGFPALAGIDQPVIHIVKVLAVSLMVRKDLRDLTDWGYFSNSQDIHLRPI